MEDKKFNLVLFDELPDSELQSEFVISGLQAFETSLFLMSQAIWPSTTLILWEACEKLLRVSARNDGHDLDAIELQGLYKNNNAALSANLNGRSHEFRTFRNKIAHKGYSPKDNLECLRLFFEAGVPYFDSLLRYLFNADKKELAGTAGEWFWRNYSDTRKVLEKKRKKEITDYGQSLLFLQLSAENIFLLGHLSQGVFRANPIHRVIDRCYQDMQWEINQVIRNQAILDLKNMGNWCVELEEPSCPLCGSPDILAEVKWESTGLDVNPRFGDLNQIVCLHENCVAYTFRIRDPEVIDVFYKSKLSDATIAYLESDKCKEVESINIGIDFPE